MNFTDKLRGLGFEPGSDYLAQDDTDGAGPYIAEWFSDRPQPAPAEIATAPETPPPAPRRMVPKSLVTQRVIDAGQIDQAMMMLQMDWGKFARWVAPDQPAVYFDDPDTLAMLVALELDPEVIMA